MNEKIIPIVIPSYEPDERLIELLKTIPLKDYYIVIVNDGSGDEYKDIFDRIPQLEGFNGVVLGYDTNCGKGFALKTAFKYLLDKFDNMTGVVTADSDGQHDINAIRDVSNALYEHPNSLIMGVRCFDQDDIPWTSVFGNKLTVKVMSFMANIKTSDTQTGLRGIPTDFMRELLDVKGNRFEFETSMLVESAGKYPIFEVPIATIYDSKENHQSHFNKITDSYKIYKILFMKFFKFLFSSLSSSVIDILLFTLFCFLLHKDDTVLYVTIATILARIISATYNYLINYIVVFKSKGSISSTLVKYIILAIVQMSASALFTTLLVYILPFNAETIIKMFVDIVLFLISYSIQQKLVFVDKKK